MELSELVNAIQVVEITAAARASALRTLAKATGLAEQGVSLEHMLTAIEEREATAQTIVADGFALPHATLDWDGEYSIVLGRSRTGVDYGVSDSGRVHLLVLLVVGKKRGDLHLTLLGTLAELLESDDFRGELVAAPNARAIKQMLRSRAGLPTERRPPSLPKVPRINAVLARQAIELCKLVGGQAVLVAVDTLHSVPWEPLLNWPGRLLVVTSKKGEELPLDRADTHLFEVPHTTLTRVDRANLGLLLAASSGLLTDRAHVICATGPGGPELDSVTVTRPAAELHAMFSTRVTRRSASIRPAVILRTLSLAIELAAEGREASPIGTMFVIGDSRNVMRHARQLVLNPFHGYSRKLRNLLDPSLGETIKEFAFLDGAFIVQADGVVLSAGTYVVPKASSVSLPSGLGTRHQAAAAISAHTQAMAITVSQSTGTVTVFRHGKTVLKLERATPTRS